MSTGRAQSVYRRARDAFGYSAQRTESRRQPVCLQMILQALFFFLILIVRRIEMINRDGGGV